MRFSNEEEIKEIVRRFEDASISREVWKHAEHLTVALHYSTLYDIDTATIKMRNGILKLLTEGFGLDLAKEMPYHETLTVFWMRTVDGFRRSTNGSSLLDNANELIERYDKDHPLSFYTREYLFSDEARSKFVEGDIENVGGN
jgi:hypothetical protein